MMLTNRPLPHLGDHHLVDPRIFCDPRSNRPAQGWRAPHGIDLLPYISQDELPIARIPPRPGVDLPPVVRQSLSLGVDGIGPEHAFAVVFRSHNIPWHRMSLTPNPHIPSLAHDNPRV